MTQIRNRLRATPVVLRINLKLGLGTLQGSLSMDRALLETGHADHRKLHLLPPQEPLLLSLHSVGTATAHKLHQEHLHISQQPVSQRTSS